MYTTPVHSPECPFWSLEARLMLSFVTFQQASTGPEAEVIYLFTVQTS